MNFNLIVFENSIYCQSSQRFILLLRSLASSTPPARLEETRWRTATRALSVPRFLGAPHAQRG